MPSLYLASIASRVAACSICLHLWIFSQCSHKKPIRSSLLIGLYLFSPKKAFFFPRTCSDSLWSLSTVCKLSKLTFLLPCLADNSHEQKIVTKINPYRVTPGIFTLEIFFPFFLSKNCSVNPQKILSFPTKNFSNLCRKNYGETWIEIIPQSLGQAPVGRGLDRVWEYHDSVGSEEIFWVRGSYWSCYGYRQRFIWVWEKETFSRLDRAGFYWRAEYSRLERAACRVYEKRSLL